MVTFQLYAFYSRMHEGRCSQAQNAASSRSKTLRPHENPSEGNLIHRSSHLDKVQSRSYGPLVWALNSESS